MTRRVSQDNWSAVQNVRSVVYGSVTRGSQISIGRILHSASGGSFKEDISAYQMSKAGNDTYVYQIDEHRDPDKE